MTHTTDILAFAAAPHKLTLAARADARRLLADTLAVGAAGAASSEMKSVMAAAKGWGESSDARVLDGTRLPAASAAFCNGFAIHCLEWDAVHEGAVVHAMSVVTAALLAASDRRGGSDEDDFLTALAIGVDIACGLGIASTGPMRFFRPATAGLIGAALAAARLQGLAPNRFADVLGLAYSFAGGTMQAHVEASIALPLQIAAAARAAIAAVDLAFAGMDGPHDALEGPFGYGALIEPLELSRYTFQIGTNWRVSEISTKPFPSGRASHGALGALAGMRADGLRLDDVAAIDLYAPPLIARLVGRPWHAAMTPSYARLCLGFLAPLILRDGLVDPVCFSSDVMADPMLASLAAHVIVHDDQCADGNAMVPQRLVVTRRDGATVEQDIPATLGSLEAPMSVDQDRQKYDLCQSLAPAADPKIFSAPLYYATDKR